MAEGEGWVNIQSKQGLGQMKLCDEIERSGKSHLDLTHQESQDPMRSVNLTGNARIKNNMKMRDGGLDHTFSPRMQNCGIRTIAVLSLIAGSLLGSSMCRAADEIKVGFMLPMTGNEASEQKTLKNAFDLAVKQVNESGGIGGKKIAPIYIDTKSGPATSMEAYETLIDRDKVFAVVSTIKSAQIVAMVPKMLKSEVPTFIGGTNPRLTTEGKWFFRTRPDDSISAVAMVRFIKDSKLTKIGIIHDTGAFGSGGANLVEKAAAGEGIKVVKRIGISIGDKNVAPSLKLIKEAGAEALIVYIANFDDAAAVIKAHGEMGKPFLYLGSPSSQSKVALDQTKDASEGNHALVDFVFGQSDVNKKYQTDYKAAYGEDPDSISTYAYDAIKILAKAVQEVGLNSDKVRNYILKLKGYQGVQGLYNFTDHGDGLHAVSIVKIVGGKPVLEKVVDVGGAGN